MFVDDWIQTVEFWSQKRLLYQLSRNLVANWCV